MKKIILTFFVLTTQILCAGCSGRQVDPTSSENQPVEFHPIQIIGQTAADGTIYRSKTDVNPDLAPDDPYPVSHTLYDNSITFCDEVAVIMHDTIKIYDPASQEITVSCETDPGEAAYAYVYYSESPSEFLFQRITRKEILQNGDTVIRLSGIPLQSEMDNEEFLRLIKTVNAYGNAQGTPFTADGE